VRIPWRRIWAERAPNWWLAAGVPMLGVFGCGFLLRVTIDSAGTPSGLVWWGYGGLGLIGLVLTAIGVAKAWGQR
jgi:hypothetical protein